MDLRKIAMKATGKKDCKNCELMSREHGHIYCDFHDDYVSNDYECPKISNNYKKCKKFDTYCYIDEDCKKCPHFLEVVERCFNELQKNIKGLTIDYFHGHHALIRGFGYSEIIHAYNYLEFELTLDKQKELWYNRWVDAFCDELEENAISNGKR